ncbi:MAG: hypothetical protein ACK56I_11270, partial [bacterium]
TAEAATGSVVATGEAAPAAEAGASTTTTTPTASAPTASAAPAGQKRGWAACRGGRRAAGQQWGTGQDRQAGRRQTQKSEQGPPHQLASSFWASRLQPVS